MFPQLQKVLGSLPVEEKYWGSSLGGQGIWCRCELHLIRVDVLQIRHNNSFGCQWFGGLRRNLEVDALFRVDFEAGDPWATELWAAP